LPTIEQINAISPTAGWRNLRFDRAARTVELLHPGMRIDLGAIGKGYAGDCAIAVLRQHGVRSALFESGGDIVVSSAPPASPGWTIRLSHPAPGVPEQICLADAAISTSGDTEQFLLVDNKRYSHVIDPRTGMALTDRWMATVIAPDGITADSLSTAAAVLGPDAGSAFVAQHPGCTAHIRRVEES
jgi:thiamine biosynthesis lipoprotein